MEEALHWAETVPIGADIPRLDWEELKERGMERRRTIHGGWVPARENDPESLATLAAYVHLKHDRTGYDGLCEFIKGRPSPGSPTP